MAKSSLISQNSTKETQRLGVSAVQIFILTDDKSDLLLKMING